MLLEFFFPKEHVHMLASRKLELSIAFILLKIHLYQQVHYRHKQLCGALTSACNRISV